MQRLSFSFPSLRTDAGARWVVRSIGAILAILLLASCAGRAESMTQPTLTTAPPQDQGGKVEGGLPTSTWDLEPQHDNAGQVEVEVTPRTLGDDVWEFAVAFNTHSVDLSFDVAEIGLLRCDQGQEYRPLAWEGSGPGGHHRSGVLKFAALDHPTSSVEVVLRDVARVPERVFHWDVPLGAQPVPDSGGTPSLASQPPSEAVGGSAKIVLSDQVFDFGDVVMSEGAVERTIELTNAGTGTLRIDRIQPT
jgi:hypothetical protein